MKVFKILHKPTGLYYTPSNGSGNLSVNGKIYARKPSLNVCIGNGIRIIVREYAVIGNELKLSSKLQKIVDYFKIKTEVWGCEKHVYGYCIDKHIDTPYEDWEIVEL